MNVPNIYEMMKALQEEITRLNTEFHQNDKELIPNAEFDQKQLRFDELCELYPDVAKSLVTDNAPVPMAAPVGGLELVEFKEPMLSLKKATSIEALDKWLGKLPPDVVVIWELKLDGLALDLLYEFRQLVRMCTRRDGLFGEDVTHSINLFNNIPLTLPPGYPDEFSIRGEGILPFVAFEAYNEAVEKPMVTPRNAASGWVRTSRGNQNPEAVGKLRFIAYGSSNRFSAKTYMDQRKMFREAGFEVSPVLSLEDLKGGERDDVLPTDGVVGKVNNFETQEELGVTNKFPNWGIAYKYPDEEVEAVYDRTIWKTGKTGRVNPTILYHPVKVGGVTCSRASIDNYHQFMELGLREDSTLAVRRNNDVIPRVHRVIDPGAGERVKAPEECPSCGSKLRLKTSDASAFLYCDNITGCKSQLLNRCLAFVSRGCLDIDGFGPVLLAELIDQGDVEYPADILFLDAATVNGNVWESLSNVWFTPFHKAILALGLPGIDVIRAKKLAVAMNKVGTDQGYRNPVSWINSEVVIEWLSNKDNLKKIHGFGAKLADPIVAAVKTDAFVNNCRRLFKRIEVTYKENVTERKICITGDVGLPRESLKDLLELAGIELADSFTKDCQLLLVGEKPGEKKLLKATELDIPMVTIARVSSIEDLITQINNHS
jgi:DNA ligase (NAD+)